MADEASPESALVVLARAGDDSAFGELVQRRQASIRGLLRRWSGDAALADDLAQDAFVHAWKSLGKLRSPGAFGGWLRQIALHTWLQYARRAKIPMDDSFVEESVQDELMPNPGTAIDLDRALTALRPPERLCLVLNLSEGMSHGEIAEATGFALGTVKSHITRGTAKLRALLEHL